MPTSPSFLPETLSASYARISRDPRDVSVLRQVASAEVDGASDWQTMRLVVVPLVSPVLLTLVLLTFLGQWSNFLWQLIVNTPDSSWITLPVGISLFKGQYSIAWEKMMAASVISVLPVLLLFLFLQRYIISGLTQGGVKE